MFGYFWTTSIVNKSILKHERENVLHLFAVRSCDGIRDCSSTCRSILPTQLQSKLNHNFVENSGHSARKTIFAQTLQTEHGTVLGRMVRRNSNLTKYGFFNVTYTTIEKLVKGLGKQKVLRNDISGTASNSGPFFVLPKCVAIGLLLALPMDGLHKNFVGGDSILKLRKYTKC